MHDFLNVAKDAVGKLFPPTDGTSKGMPDPHDVVFHPYYIAGRYPTQIDGVFASAFADAYAEICGPKTVAIGKDSRNASSKLATECARVLLARGIDVVELDITTTPFARWVAREQGIDALMVTASKNDAAWSGFKLYTGAAGEPPKPDLLTDIKKQMTSNSHAGRYQKQGTVLHHSEWRENYVKLLMDTVGSNPKRKLRVAVDYSSGGASIYINPMLRELGISFSTLNEQPSGTFPGHGPNPVRDSTWEGLAHLVKRGRYHLGVVFDVAGEYAIFVDEKGRHISTSQLVALLAYHYLPKADHWRNAVISNALSMSIKQAAEKAGGRVYRSPEEYREMIEHMRVHRAILGAMSEGRYFFKEIGYHDDAALAFAKVLRILRDHKRTQISELIELYNPSRARLSVQRIPHEQGTKDTILRELRRHFQGDITVDVGLRVKFKTWWFHIHHDKEDGHWVLTLEGESRERLERKRREIEAIIKNIKELTKE